MKYLGGKSKIAKWLVAAMRPHLRGRAFWDAFCGGLSVSRELAAVCPGGLISDANPALISMYAAIARGWDPPSTVTEAEYAAARALPDTDPRKALIGFGSSFGGKWFGGFARSTAASGEPRNHLAEARRALVEEVPELVGRGCEFAHINFLEIEPKPIDLVLYLDPPYQGTTGYGALGAFDYPRFYDCIVAWSRHTDVFVSEYALPVGRCVLEFGHLMSVAGGAQSNARTERLFHLNPADNL